MHTSMVLSTNLFRPLVQIAQDAEEAGFHRVWTTESTPRDAIVRAVALGMNTTRIGVAPGIAYAFSRAPLAMAAAVADAQIATQGRFAIGIGAGTKGMRTRRYGIHDFDHPGSRLGEYAQLMRAAWSGEPNLRFDGDFYKLEVPGVLRSDELDGLPPIDIVGSGVNETMLRLSAKFCEGVALHPLVTLSSYLDGVAVPAMAKGAAAGEFDPWIAAWRITAVDEDEAAARLRARANLAFYFTTPSYHSVPAGTEWAEPLARVRDAFRENPRLTYTELGDMVPDGIVDEFCLTATPRTLPGKLAEQRDALAARGVSEFVVQVAGTGLSPDEYVKACLTITRNVGMVAG